jgi:hypothetical protein
MKKIFLLAIASLLFSFSNFAQIGDANILDSIVTITATGEYFRKTIYEHPASNQTIEKQYLWENSDHDWTLSAITETQLDEKENILFKTFHNFGPCLDDMSLIGINRGYGYKDEYEYDADGNQISNMHYNWDCESGDWVKSSQTKFDFDENNNKILTISYFWYYDLNDWRAHEKIEMAYDADNNMTLYIQYQWKSSTNSWEGYTKTEIEYANDREKTYVYYQWNSSTKEWDIYSKAEFEYTTDTEVSTFYFWNGYWVLSQKKETTFDANHNPILVAYYNWDFAIQNWRGNAKNESKYGINNNLTESVGYGWDYNTNSFTKQSKQVYEYDTYGNQLVSCFYSWIMSNNDWEGRHKTETKYNTDGDRILETQYEFDASTKVWKITATLYYYYSNFRATPADIQNAPSETPINVYPNPVNCFSVLNIRSEEILNKIEIYSISGSLIQRKNTGSSTQFSLSELNIFKPGIYLIKLVGTTDTITKKLIVN